MIVARRDGAAPIPAQSYIDWARIAFESKHCPASLDPHTLSVLSPEADIARRPSTLNATLKRKVFVALKRTQSCPVATSHTFHCALGKAEAARRPSAERDAAHRTRPPRQRKLRDLRPSTTFHTVMCRPRGGHHDFPSFLKDTPLTPRLRPSKVWRTVVCRAGEAQAKVVEARLSATPGNPAAYCLFVRLMQQKSPYHLEQTALGHSR